MSNSAFTPAVLTIPAAATTATGELNVISNPSAASLSTTGWTGVTAVGTNSPLNPTVTTAFSIANTAGAESSTSGGYASFTMPSGLQNKKLKVEFYFTTPATDVYKVSVYKGGSRVTLTTDSSGSTTLPASTTGKFVAYFDTDTSANWTVNITRTSGSTGPIYVTNVIVGPGIQPQGAVVGEWTSYTPTWTGLGTVTNQVAQYRRVGSNLELIVRTLSGTADGSNLSVSLPSGLTSSALNQIVIVGYGKSNGTTVSLTVAINSSASNTLLIGDFTASFFSQIVGTAIGNSKVVDIQATIPITEWASSGTVQLAQNDVEWAWNSSTSTTTDSTSFAYGPAGSTGVLQTTALTAPRLKRVRFQTPIQISDVLTIEVQTSTSPNSWIPLTSSPYSLNYTEQNTASYGLGIRQVSGSSTDVDIAFGRYIYANGTAFAAVGVEWNNAGAVGLRAWRVRKSSAGAAVGFGVVNSVSTGLVTPMTPQTALTFSASTPAATIVRAVGIAYTDIGGIWRLRFNIVYDVANGLRTTSTVTLSGTTFKNFVNFAQPVTVACSAGALKQQAYTASNAGIITVEHESATTSRYHLSGDVELESKPTWA